MRLDVDDARGDYEPACVDPTLRRRLREHAGRRYARDVVADDADVTVKPGVARPIDDLAAADDGFVWRIG